MAIEIVTKDDLEEFRKKLLEDITELLQSKPAPKRWLKTHEVMELLQMSDVTLHKLRDNGTIPFIKLGHICYYDLTEIDKVLENAKG